MVSMLQNFSGRAVNDVSQCTQSGKSSLSFSALVFIKLSLQQAIRPIGLWDVKAPTFSLVRSQMAVRLSALYAGCLLPPRQDSLVFIILYWNASAYAIIFVKYLVPMLIQFT
jgi:hypothetical protein